MSLIFLLDEDISDRVAKGLRQRGIDAISVHEVGRAGQALADEEQLRFAADHGRVLVTHNRADYQAQDAERRHHVQRSLHVRRRAALNSIVHEQKSVDIFRRGDRCDD